MAFDSTAAPPGTAPAPGKAPPPNKDKGPVPDDNDQPPARIGMGRQRRDRGRRGSCGDGAFRRTGAV